MPVFRTLVPLLCSLLVGSAALAQAFPAKTVTLVVPYPAGGLSDVIARTLTPLLSKKLGQPVIVENLGGASGGIAAQKVLNNAADGYLIFQGSPNELVLAPMFNPGLKYKSEDFRLLQMISINQLALFGRKDLPAGNGDELIAYAKKTAAAGKPLTYASVGNGTLYHLLGEHMAQATGVPMTHVPYRGAAPAFQGLMGGEVDIFITPYGKGQVQLVDDGRLKVVAALSTERQELIKKAPTLNESQALKGFVFETWAGYFVPQNTPDAVVQLLHKALSEVADDPAIRAALEAQDMIVPRPQAQPVLDKLYIDNTAKFRALGKQLAVQP